MKLASFVAIAAVISISALSTSCSSTTINNVPQTPLGVVDTASKATFSKEEIDELANILAEETANDYERKVQIEMEADYARTVNQIVLQNQRNSHAQQAAIYEYMRD